METIKNQLNEMFGESILDNEYYNGEKEAMAGIFSALTRSVVYDNPLDDREAKEAARLLSQYLVLMDDIRELAKREAQLSA